MAQGLKLDMGSSTTFIDMRPVYRQLAFASLSLASAFALAQTIEHFDPQANFDQRVTDEIFDSAGQWRQPEADENQWRAGEDKTVNNRRFHFGSDSAYEQMQYRSDDRYRNMGSAYDDIRPSPLLRYNF